MERMSCKPDGIGFSDSCRILTSRFKNVDNLLVLGRGPSSLDPRIRHEEFDGILVVDPTYALRDVFDGNPMAVLIGDHTQVAGKVVERYLNAAPEERPLLMSTYVSPPDEPSCLSDKLESLPPPIPILPILKKTDLYTDDPPYPYPTSGVFLTLLAAALGKRCLVAGIDLYRHPNGRIYANCAVNPDLPAWPERHSEEVDVRHLKKAVRRLGDRIEIIGVAGEVLKADKK